LARGIIVEQSGSDVIGFAGIARVSKGREPGIIRWALVLAVRGMADFFGESVVGVLQRTHHGSMDADVESFQAIEITGGIEEPVKGFSVGAVGSGEAENGSIGGGNDRRSVCGVVE